MDEPRTFTDPTAARDWLDHEFAEWAADLTEQQRIALSTYKALGYQAINDGARNGRPAPSESPSTPRSQRMNSAPMLLPRGSAFRLLDDPTFRAAPAFDQRGY